MVAQHHKDRFFPDGINQKIKKLRHFLPAPAMGGIAGEQDGVGTLGRLCDARKHLARFPPPERLHMKLRLRCRRQSQNENQRTELVSSVLHRALPCLLRMICTTGMYHR